MKNELKEKIEKEGNEYEFEAYGMQCYMSRHPGAGHWCGYVKIPKESRLYEARTYYSTDSELGLSDFEKSINNLEVHGGITFSGDRRKDGDMYWGFDCAHLGDISPNYDFKMDGDTYKNKEYVIEECKNLAKQLKEIIGTYQN